MPIDFKSYTQTPLRTPLQTPVCTPLQRITRFVPRVQQHEMWGEGAIQFREGVY